VPCLVLHADKQRAARGVCEGHERFQRRVGRGQVALELQGLGLGALEDLGSGPWCSAMCSEAACEIKVPRALVGTAPPEVAFGCCHEAACQDRRLRGRDASRCGMSPPGSAL
jgi:hypothetical protein